MPDNGISQLLRSLWLWATAAAFVVAMVGAPAASTRPTDRTGPAASPAVTCRLEKLPVPDGTWRSNIRAGDTTGRYLVGDAAVLVDGETTIQQLLWVDGRLATVRTPYAQPFFVDVNSTGTVVGFSVTDGHHSAFQYKLGRVTGLPGLNPGDGSVAVAVNNRGDILGYSTNSNGDRIDVVWPAGRLQHPREIVEPIPLGGVDIDQDGTVLAVQVSAEEIVSYLLAPDGSAHIARGPTGSTSVHAFAIANGWIGGFHPASSGMAMTWRPGGGPVNRVPDGYETTFAINGHGDIGLYGAIDRRQGGLVPLPSLGGPSGVSTLSDRGTAAGFANDGSQVHAVVWRGC
jgi:hypothetical protein